MVDLYMQAKQMQRNSDVQTVIDGELVDMRIEMLLAYIHAGTWNVENLDVLLHEVAREFVHEDAPLLNLRAINKMDGGLVNYLSILELDFKVTFRSSNNWSGFSYCPSAICMVSVAHPANPDEYTAPQPGQCINQAVLAAIVQYAREVSRVEANQGTFPLTIN